MSADRFRPNRDEAPPRRETALHVWKISWPMVVLGVARASYLAVDTVFVGRLGAAALAAIGAASFAWWIVLQVVEAATTGTQSRVARAEGAGQSQEAVVWLTQGTWAALCLAGSVILTCPWWIPAYLDAVGLTPDLPARALAATWLTATAWGALAFALHGVVSAVFRGIGWTRTALVVTGVSFALNAVLDPLLIFGVGPWAGLGIAGAAWATALAEASTAGLGLLLLARAGRVPRLAVPEWAAMRAVVAVGGPVSVSGVGFSLVYVVLARLILAEGPEHIAALGIGHRIESFAYMTAVGFMVGTSTVVGQRLGASDRVGALEAARVSASMCAAFMVAAGVLALVLAEPGYRLFTDDPAIVAAGVVYLRTQAMVWVFMGWESVYEGAFAGAAHTRPALVVGLVGTTARIPLAWALAVGVGMGAPGIWLAIAGSTLVKGLWMRGWFHRSLAPSVMRA